MNSYGADFVKKIRPLGAAIILIISALSIIVMFTANVTPISELESVPETEPAPQTQIACDEYYLDCLEYN